MAEDEKKTKKKSVKFGKNELRSGAILLFLATSFIDNYIATVVSGIFIGIILAFVPVIRKNIESTIKQVSEFKEFKKLNK